MERASHIYTFSIEQMLNTQIDIHIVLKNYKYTKSLLLNTLRYNHLPTKTKKKKGNKIIYIYIYLYLILG